MICSLLAAAALTLQGPVVKDSAFFRKGDGALAIAAVAATGVTAVFDERIARWARGPSVQGDSSRHNAVEAATVVNEVPLTVVATVVLDETLRIAIGRTRPRSDPDNAFAFHPGGGLSHFDERSFPSLHSAVAFATAARDSPAATTLDRILLHASVLPGRTGTRVAWSFTR
jgi:hypothetical protein